MDRITIWNSEGNEGLVCLNDNVRVTLHNGDVFEDTVVSFYDDFVVLSDRGEYYLFDITCIDVI